VDAIEAKFPDPKRRCQEFFKDWLKDNGKCAGPKSWSTLLGAIKTVNELTKVREEIVEELTRQDLA